MLGTLRTANEVKEEISVLLESWTVTWFVASNIGTLALAIGVYVWREFAKSRSTGSEEGDRVGSVSQSGSE